MKKSGMFVYWRASVASETLTGVTQSKIGDVYKFICLYICDRFCENRPKRGDYHFLFFYRNGLTVV